MGEGGASQYQSTKEDWQGNSSASAGSGLAEGVGSEIVSYGKGKKDLRRGKDFP